MAVWQTAAGRDSGGHVGCGMPIFCYHSPLCRTAVSLCFMGDPVLSIALCLISFAGNTMLGSLGREHCSVIGTHYLHDIEPLQLKDYIVGDMKDLCLRPE